MATVDLSGQVVAVTGASSGIGEATAVAVAQAGAAVALAARRSDRIEALAERIAACGGRAVAIATDVGEEDQAGEFVRRAHAELGRLDVLVNNAGVMLLGPIESAPTEEWRRMIHANVFGVLYCTHAALPLMKRAGVGAHRQRQLRRRAGRAAGLGRLQPHEVRRRRVLGVVAPGGRGARRARDADRAGRGRHRAPGHNRPEVLEQMAKRFAGVTPLESKDIANAILYAIGQPPNVSINEVLVRPSGQAG